MGKYDHKIPIPIASRVCVTERKNLYVCAHTCKHVHMVVAVGWVQHSVSGLVIISHVLQ
jgi:hypothetical protein